VKCKVDIVRAQEVRWVTVRGRRIMGMLCVEEEMKMNDISSLEN
jgi:hypothetical protein